MRRTGHILACSVVLALLLVGGPAQGNNPKAARAVQVTEKQSGSTVELTTGQELLVSLGMQTGTGFTWLVAGSPGKLLEQQGEPKLERENPGKPGAPARQVFRFKAVAAGEGNLELVYRRPFEKEVKPAKTFQVKVQVKPAP